MTDLKPDAKAAVDFLRRLHPRRLWNLAAFHPDNEGEQDIKTFSPEQAAECQEWVALQNGKGRNVYFHLNLAGARRNIKARKHDIRDVIALHSDIDPRAGEDRDAERARILQRLNDEPLPTAIIDSGNGYQAIWVLREPIAIDGSEEAADEAARYNHQLALLTEGDIPARDVSRVLRLPGTINWPNPKKRGKGYRPANAKLVAWHADRLYDLNQFTKAPATSPKGEARQVTAAPATKITDLAFLDQWQVPSWVKEIVATGRCETRQKKGDHSRNGFMYWALCELCRRAVPDEVLLSLLLDPAHGISAHVLAQKNAERYARKQIEDARASIEEPWLEELNAQFAVIFNHGGKTRVMACDDGERAFQTVADFRLRLGNRYLSYEVTEDDGNGGTKTKTIKQPLADKWLKHEHRRSFNRCRFLPGLPTPDGVLNTWDGFGFEAAPGDCSLFVELIDTVIAGGNAEHAAWLWNWMAHLVQRPGDPSQIAVILRGQPGTGKSAFAKALGRLFGRHFTHLTDQKHIFGNFNAIVSERKLVFGDEVFASKDPRIIANLKRLITEETITIERKGVDTIEEQRFFALIVASNDRWVVPADIDERRYLVLDVGNARKQDFAFFKAFWAQMEGGGYAALLHRLLKRDISAFNHRERPITAALTDQKLHSLRGAERFVRELLTHGNIDAWFVENKDQVFVATHDLWNTYGERYHFDETALGRALAKVAHIKTSQRRRHEGEQKRGYLLPRLSVARKLFEENLIKAAVPWPDDDGEWSCSEAKEPF